MAEICGEDSIYCLAISIYFDLLVCQSLNNGNEKLVWVKIRRLILIYLKELCDEMERQQYSRFDGHMAKIYFQIKQE